MLQQEVSLTFISALHILREQRQELGGSPVLDDLEARLLAGLPSAVVMPSSTGEVACPVCGPGTHLATVEVVDASAAVAFNDETGGYEHEGETIDFASETVTNAVGQPLLECKGCASRFWAAIDL